jgi:hypothetical protein
VLDIEGRDGALGVIGTDVDALDERAARGRGGQQFKQPVVGAGDIGERADAPGHQPLIAHHDECVARVHKPFARLPNAGQQAHERRIAQVARRRADPRPGEIPVLDQGVIAIKKDGGSHNRIMGASTSC